MPLRHTNEYLISRSRTIHDLLGKGVPMRAVADEFGISVMSVYVAAMSPDARAHETKPEGSLGIWEAVHRAGVPWHKLNLAGRYGKIRIDAYGGGRIVYLDEVRALKESA